MKKNKKTKGAIGAIVQYCGHDATFVADIIEVGDACVVVANGDVNKHLRRPSDGATHHLIDFPKAGYWNPQKGIFVVPADQVKVF